MQKGNGSSASLLDEALAYAGPFAEQIGIGALSGYATGMALRVFGKAAGATVGVLFCGLQAASYSGYIDVDWAKVERAVTRVLDSDGDGKLTVNDAKLGLNKLQTVLAFNLPGSTGFASGLTYAVGGRLGRAAVLTSVALAAPTLYTAHAYATTPSFKHTVEEVAPPVAAWLGSALEHASGRAEQLLAASTAPQRPRVLPTLEALRKEEARARLEARLLTGDKKMTPQKLAALERCEKTLIRIEEDKRAIKAAAKAAKGQRKLW